MNDFNNENLSFDSFLSTVAPNVSSSSGYSLAADTLNSFVSGFASGGLVGGGIQAAFTGFQDAINMVGKGRREADEITAIQTPFGDFLVMVNAEMDNDTLDRLMFLRKVLVQQGDQFRQVLARPWQDGRAASRATQEFFSASGTYTILLQNLDRNIRARGGNPDGTAAPAASADNGLGGLAAVAGAAWLLLGH